MSALSLLEPKTKRSNPPLGLSAVLLDPIHAPTQQFVPQIIYDNSSGTQQPPLSATSSFFPNTFSGTEPASGVVKVANYMAATRHTQDADRHHKGPKASGFSNCFQSQELLELSWSLTQPSESIRESNHSLNGFKDRRILHPGPEEEGSAVEINDPANIAVKSQSQNQNQGSLRTLAAQRRRQERERERDDEDYGREKSSKHTKVSDSENQASAMQRKLVQMWDCLQVIRGAKRIQLQC